MASDDLFDPYLELQLQAGAEPEIVKASFKALAKKYHPDLCQSPTEKAMAEEKMARLNRAQQMILSGNFRKVEQNPPVSAEPQTSAPPIKSESPKPAPTTKSPSPLKAKLDTRIIVLILAIFAIIVSLPRWSSTRHLARALEYEKENRLQESVNELNEAIVQTPSNNQLYVHRARLWQKLGEPEKAALDWRNSGRSGNLPGQVTPTPSEKTRTNVP